jgi:prepilin-type N-terminal cleavage/methylation domain-containing protein
MGSIPRQINSSMAVARAMRTPRKRRRGFTLIEVALGMAILAAGLTGMIEGMVLGYEMLETAHQQTLAAQIMQSEVEYLRMQPWSTIQNLNSTSATSLANYTEFSSSSLKTITTGTTIKFARTVVSPDPHTYLRQVKMTVTWTSFTGKSHTRSCSAYIGRYGLRVSYQKF